MIPSCVGLAALHQPTLHQPTLHQPHAENLIMVAQQTLTLGTDVTTLAASSLPEISCSWKSWR
jgi:hypothetical protein